MRHLKRGRKLSRSASHRKALMANLACALVSHGSIRTTDAKAKELRPFIERLITFAKRGDLHARRLVLSRIHSKETVAKLFNDIAPEYIDRAGGYTRIIKIGSRHGDNTPVSIIEFVNEEKKVSASPKRKVKVKKPDVKEKPAALEEEAVVEAEVEEAGEKETVEEVEKGAEEEADAVGEIEDDKAEKAVDTSEEKSDEKEEAEVKGKKSEG